MNVIVFYLKNVILYSKVKYITQCSLQGYNLPWTIRQISIGYPLISGDLRRPTAYDLPCGASHLFRVIAYRRACVLHLHQWPNALRSSSTAADFNFGVLH